MAKVEIFGVQHDYQWTPTKAESEMTVVFVHGWLLSQHYWRPIIQQMRSRFSCLSYDLRGFGSSNQQIFPHDSNVGHSNLDGSSILMLAERQCQRSPFSPAAFGRDLLMLLQVLDIQRAWLVGHSLGGTISVWATAMNHAQRQMGMEVPQIEGLIGLNSGGGIYVEEDFNKFRAAGRQILKFRPTWLERVPGLDWVFSHSNVASSVSRKWGRQLLRDFLRVNPAAGEGALLDSTTAEEVLLLPKLMQQIKQPAYLIAGDRDQVMAPRFVHHLASFHPLFQSAESNVFQLENCGHMGMIEQPQQVSELITKLLDRHTASSRFPGESESGHQA